MIVGKILIIPSTSWWGFLCKWGGPHIGLPGSLPHTMLFAPTTHMIASKRSHERMVELSWATIVAYCLKTIWCIVSKLYCIVVCWSINLLYLLWTIWCICCEQFVYLYGNFFVNLWSLFDLLWCIIGCDCYFRWRCALYNGASGEGTFLTLANSLQFSASGERKFAAARGIRLQRASSDVYRAEI
jgi:hypothetical protein